jgi:hypothetical protein
MVPLSVLGRMRREMIEQLDAAATRRPVHQLAPTSPLALLRAGLHSHSPLPLSGEGPGVRAAARCSGLSPAALTLTLSQSCRSGRRERGPISPAALTQRESGPISECPRPQCHVLCRSLEQLESVLASDTSSVMAELPELAKCPDAVRLARARRAEIFLAAPRIQKPGEMAVLEELLQCKADGILVRNLAGAAFCAERGIRFVADFSLHAANELTVGVLRELGADRVTAAYDLAPTALLQLATLVPLERLEVVVYQHMPMFHTEHRVLAADCRRHSVRLRDRRGAAHPLRADLCSRNTLYHADAQDQIDQLPRWLASGVRHFRVELLDGAPREELAQVLNAIRRVGAE